MDSQGTPAYPEKNHPFKTPAGQGHQLTITKKEPLSLPCPQPSEKTVVKPNTRREQGILKDALFFIKRGDSYHAISENYSYKTETYYSILHHELEGKNVRPSSRVILDAYVVPLCLERAKRGGIPVCDWGISQGYVPLPVIVYGLNYFATTSEFFVVQDNTRAKEVIKHITNTGKYPFCYQKLEEGATIHSCIGIFGKTTDTSRSISELAHEVYELFSIPLVTMLFVKSKEEFRLSSLAPTKYSQLSTEERSLLFAYLSNQEFL
ncbi:MAG: RimK-like ATPgrasp N-terminal domain-containing protein [Methanoregula sp.]|nr:RimK-like ATPgrasp N-terminal domain-containing protein [Methanoregula sp.]